MPTIFYAWQSDAPAGINRYFIRDTLEQAVRELNANLDIDDALDIDSDTQGVAGSPPVAETILKKINECLVFVADLTLVAKTTPAGSRKEKQLPNANVLIELGYTRCKHGYGALVQVMNTYFGPPEALPFDLAHLRHPIKYELAPDATASERKHVRAELVGRLREALRAVLDDRGKAHVNKPVPLPRGSLVLDRGTERFQTRVKESAVELPPHGAFEVGVQVIGYPKELHPDRDFLDLITRVNPGYRHWPLWMNPTLINDPSVKPKVRDGLWETVLILLDSNKWRAPSIDYWFASPLGWFYHRRGLWEDGLWPATGHRPYEPGTVLDLAQQAAVVAEAFVLGQAFARAMNVPNTAPNIHFEFRWTHLRRKF